MQLQCSCREGCSCQVNVLFLVVVGGVYIYLSVFVWVVGSCLAVSRLDVLMSQRLFVILYMVVSLPQHFSVLLLGLARRGERPCKVDPDVDVSQ